MINYLIIEFKKIFKSKTFYLSLLILTIISIFSAITSIKNFDHYYDFYVRLFSDRDRFPNGYLLLNLISSHRYWIGVDVFPNFYAQFYYFIFPLLIGMPVVQLIYNDLKTGNIYYYFTRMSKSKYYIGKYIVAFCISIILFIIPIVINILIINGYTGIWDYSSYSQTMNNVFDPNNILYSFHDNYDPQPVELFCNLYVNQPYLYGAVYYLIGALFGSLYVMIGLSCSLFIKNRYLLILIPLITYLGFWIFYSALNLQGFDPFNTIFPSQPVENITYSSFIINYLILIIMAIVFFILGVKKNENNI